MISSVLVIELVKNFMHCIIRMNFEVKSFND